MNKLIGLVSQPWQCNRHTLQSGIDVPPTIFFSKMHTMTFLLQPPRLLSLSIDEIVRPRHNSNAIDRVIACVTMYDL